MSKCTALRKILETHTCRCWDIIYMHTSSHAHRIALHEIINSGLYQRYLSQFLPLKKDSPAQSCIESGLLSNSQPYIGGGGATICFERLGVCWFFPIQPRSAPGDSFFLCGWWSANLWNNLLQSLAGMKTCRLLGPVWPVPALIQRKTAHTNTGDLFLFL